MGGLTSIQSGLAVKREAVLRVEGSISICKACKELLQVATPFLRFGILSCSSFFEMSNSWDV
ncbi:MAG TPA: hypothetical protein DCL61_03695 [Cyanobacteria bacterium UBA12227]|nr:hypothetical protein [Cyanobacteria bacterium UBA12227]HAX88050.1 hypothetical protein [Cyanobacteria bacterium UBA11370]